MINKYLLLSNETKIDNSLNFSAIIKINHRI